MKSNKEEVIMEKTDVLIIGGSASGVVAAVTGKNNYPEKDFLLVRKEKKVLVPCGIPYIYGTLGSTDKNLIPDALLEKAGVALRIGEVVLLDQQKKTCSLSDGEQIQFEKLILATGSTPLVPPTLKGTELENVFTFPKNKDYHDKLFDALKEATRVVVIGGGFIGVEMADELKKIGKDVTVVEVLPNILGLVLDRDLVIKAQSVLESRGVKVKTGTKVVEITGQGKVSGVVFQDGEKLDADLVILAMGYRPSVDLAKNAGIKISDMGRVRVDEYMRTENPDIFAIGDCAEKRDFITRRPSGVMLASISCAEARVAALNLYGLSSVKTFKGTIAIFSTAIGGVGFGAAGLTEEAAKAGGFDIVAGTFEGVDKHPGTLPGTQAQTVKLIASRDSGVVLGGEVIGGCSTGELINLIGFVIQNMMTVDNLVVSQIGTHPLLTAAPTAYPVIKAAEIVLRKIRQKGD